jgi:glycosyltransferase involved in cell wall biosynthesis
MAIFYMTTIVINAVSVREGGSLVVLRELLAVMTLLRPNWQWHVTTNATARALLPAFHNTSFHVYSESQLAGWRIRYWYESELQRLVCETGADLLFSQTNYLPWRTLPCPTLLLVQHAGHFSPLFCQLTEQQITGWLSILNWRLKGQWVRASVRRATCLTVQTQALALDISRMTGVNPANIAVIPHGSGLLASDGTLPTQPPRTQPLRIGYISKAGVQKNFGVLLAAAAGLHRLGYQLVLVLTLDAGKQENQAVLAQAQLLGIAELIENHGELDNAGIKKLYRTLHCFVFASLCESFGFPLVEAMACGLPLCIADTASNREVAGEAGTGAVFAATDADALAGQLARLVDEPPWYELQARRSLARSAAFSWELAAAKTLLLVESLIPAGAASPSP